MTTLAAIREFLATTFPQSKGTVEQVGHSSATVRQSVPLTVTTNLNINFLRKPAADRDIIAVCKLLKVGKSLAVGEVALFSEGDPERIAHAMGTYSIPKPGTTSGDMRLMPGHNR
jgi:acyl-coenzyme A thioesterase PaaI-like protein